MNMDFMLIAILSVVRTQSSSQVFAAQKCAIARLKPEFSARQGWASRATGKRITPFHFFSFLLFESIWGRSGGFSPIFF